MTSIKVCIPSNYSLQEIINHLEKVLFNKVVKTIFETRLTSEYNDKYILFVGYRDSYNQDDLVLIVCCIYRDIARLYYYTIEEFIFMIDSGACKSQIVELFNNSSYSKSLRLL